MMQTIKIAFENKLIKDDKSISELKTIHPELDEGFLIAIRALELIETFIKGIDKIRSKFKIPSEGFSFKTYPLLKEILSLKFSKLELKILSLQNQQDFDYEVARLAQKVNLKMFLFEDSENYCLVRDIVLWNIVYCKEISTNGIEVNESNYEKGLFIKMKRKISEKELIRFVGRHWSYIGDKLNSLDSEKEFYISERDLDIVWYRDFGKLKFTKIADILYRFDKTTSSEDAVKKAYKRAKDKIKELYKR